MQSLQHNGSLYAHIFVTKDKAPIDPRHPSFHADSLVYHRHRKKTNMARSIRWSVCTDHLHKVLTKFYPKRTEVKQKNLLHRGEDDETEEKNHDEQEVRQSIDKTAQGDR